MGSRFRKKPIEIEAFQWDGVAIPEAPFWARAALEDNVLSVFASQLMIKTLEGTMRAEPGDWIIRGVKKELYPCKPDIFEATYEPAD